MSRWSPLGVIRFSRCAGYDIILNVTAKDATEDFDEIGHSNAAREMLDKYYVADFAVRPPPFRAPELSPRSLARPPARDPNSETNSDSEACLVRCLWLVPPSSLSSVWFDSSPMHP